MAHLNIRIAYPWGKGATSKDQKYLFLKGLVRNTASAVEKMAVLEGAAIQVSVSRLRARHGVEILAEIRRRIRSADVLLFDLDNENPNVLIELGIALSSIENAPAIFILLKEGQKIPSDLSGYLITFYREIEDYRLVDSSGFTAALRSELMARAREKGISFGSNLAPNEDAIKSPEISHQTQRKIF